MIIASTGEVCFEGGLSVSPHEEYRLLWVAVVRRNSELGIFPNPATRVLPIAGWRQHHLGVHKSNRGDFEMEVVTGPEQRVEAVFLSHQHSFYDPKTPDDEERRVFHDNVIALDLCGQREFSWGHVFCRVDTGANRDWLILIYNPFAAVPLRAREVFRRLFAREEPPPD